MNACDNLHFEIRERLIGDIVTRTAYNIYILQSRWTQSPWKTIIVQLYIVREAIGKRARIPHEWINLKRLKFTLDPNSSIVGGKWF